MAGHLVVVGGANVDVKARSSAPALPATSNPGRSLLSLGGVGRNIAENLARLSAPVHLVAAVGTDPWGEWLLAETAAAGVDTARVAATAPRTGTYTAVLDADGELVVAVADMAATDALTAAEVTACADLVAGAALVVLDGNLAVPALAAALDLARGHDVPVVLDPVSVPKAARLARLLDGTRAVHTLTPNRAELAALVGADSAPAAAAATLHARGVATVWVRLGAEGSLLLADGAPPVELPRAPGPVVDVTGAGDAMLAAYCCALLAGRTPRDAAGYGQRAAALTVASELTVRPDLLDVLGRPDGGAP